MPPGYAMYNPGMMYVGPQASPVAHLALAPTAFAPTAFDTGIIMSRQAYLLSPCVLPGCCTQSHGFRYLSPSDHCAMGYLWDVCA